MTLEGCERYWKIPELLDVRFSCALNVEDPAQAVFQTLHTCHRLLRDWTVCGPYPLANGIWMLHGQAVKKEQGIELIFFEIGNAGTAASKMEPPSPITIESPAL